MLAVLIICLNHRDKTLECLTHLFAQQGIDDVGIVVCPVNDGCTDGIPQAVIEAFPQVRIIDADGPLFWNHAMHLAVEKVIEKGYYFYYVVERR